jgi:hypothetical protein
MTARCVLGNGQLGLSFLELAERVRTRAGMSFDAVDQNQPRMEEFTGRGRLLFCAPAA